MGVPGELFRNYNGGLEGHGRFQVYQTFIHFVGRVAAVENDPGTNCIEPDSGTSIVAALLA